MRTTKDLSSDSNFLNLIQVSDHKRLFRISSSIFIGDYSDMVLHPVEIQSLSQFQYGL